MNYFCERCGITENVDGVILGGAFGCYLCSKCRREWDQWAIDLPETARQQELMSVIKVWQNYKISEDNEILTKIHHLYLNWRENEKRLFIIAENWMKREMGEQVDLEYSRVGT